MNRIRPILIFAAGLIISAGCTSAPTQDQLDNADFGPEMTQYLCEAAVTEYIKVVLKDPESASYNRFSRCTKQISWVMSSDNKHSGRVAGYMISFEVNAKNSFGGYTGATAMHALIRGAELVTLTEGPCKTNNYGYGFCYGDEELYMPNGGILRRMVNESGFSD